MSRSTFKERIVGGFLIIFFGIMCIVAGFRVLRYVPQISDFFKVFILIFGLIFTVIGCLVLLGKTTIYYGGYEPYE
ncbi:MAG: hypothetical protein ACFE8U_15625 [Candidatus Hermodarchaeota archaeon]